MSDIKMAYEEIVEHRISSGQIYRVLKRHGWRKVKLRSRHPKKATPEVIEALKNQHPNRRIEGSFQQFTHRQEPFNVQDEAGFGRINKPKYCWCRKG